MQVTLARKPHIRDVCLKIHFTDTKCESNPSTDYSHPR